MNSKPVLVCRARQASEYCRTHKSTHCFLFLGYAIGFRSCIVETFCTHIYDRIDPLSSKASCSAPSWRKPVRQHSETCLIVLLFGKYSLQCNWLKRSPRLPLSPNPDAGHHHAQVACLVGKNMRRALQQPPLSFNRSAESTSTHT